MESASRPGRPARKPTLEALEGRSLLAAGQVSLATLLTPIPEGTPLAEHIHPRLTLVVGGQRQTVPAGIGILAAGNLPLHTHDSSGTIHIEATSQQPFRLGDFLTIWGQTVNSHNVLGHEADATHRVTMTVNGRPSRAFGSLLLQDGQNIVIRYDATPPRGVRHLRGR